jgi:hypothetical protein
MQDDLCMAFLEVNASKREAAMDIYGLAAAHIHSQPRSSPMNAQAENRYYANQICLPSLHPGLIGSVAMIAGIILLVGTNAN